MSEIQREMNDGGWGTGVEQRAAATWPRFLPPSVRRVSLARQSSYVQCAQCAFMGEPRYNPGNIHQRGTRLPALSSLFPLNGDPLSASPRLSSVSTKISLGREQRVKIARNKSEKVNFQGFARDAFAIVCEAAPPSLDLGIKIQDQSSGEIKLSVLKPDNTERIKR